MNNCVCILSDNSNFGAQSEILSAPAAYFMMAVAKDAAFKDCYTVGSPCSSLECENLPHSASASAFLPLTQKAIVYDSVLVFFHALPCITSETITRLLGAPSSLLTNAKHEPLALFAPLHIVTQLSGNISALVGELSALGPIFTEFPIAADDGTAIIDAISLYENQELLRRRINFAAMRSGVTVVDPNATHISPRAVLESGAYIMPGCFIYGKSHIEAMAKIGPNSMIVDSIIGCGSSVNSSQVYESSIGAQTNIGPFAYVRPGCDIGEKVKIGDFVELKKAKIGNGTKISHLAYIGDATIGQRCNIGCGAITVNYDGKNKFQTVVEDDCFIGCNSNLLSPVTVNAGAYIAAGSTITDEVPGGSLAIARARQVNKENWATNRRKSGDL